MVQGEGGSETNSLALNLTDVSISGNKPLSKERYPCLSFDISGSHRNTDIGLAMERSAATPEREDFPQCMAFGDFGCHPFGGINRDVAAMELTEQTKVQSRASFLALPG